MQVCKHCNEEFNLPGKVFSNHVRWCDKNPDRNNLKNLTNAINKSNDEKYGKKQEFEKICPKCGNTFIVFCRKSQLDNPKKVKQYCSRKCANSRPQSKETNDKRRSTLLANDDWLINVRQHNINRSNNKIGLGIVIRTCLYCGKQHTLKRKYCSAECVKAKKQEHLTERVKYRHNCQFKFALNSYPDEFNFELIKKFGWYKAKNHGDNLNGVSRDHIVSIKHGYTNNIDPTIIAHPANCQLLRHNDNVSKYDKCDITLEELQSKITEWDKKYPLTSQ